MGNAPSVEKHSNSDAIALGRAATDNSAWVNTVFGGLFIIGSLIFLVLFISYPSTIDCVTDSDCSDNDTCNKDRNHCNNKKRNVNYLIGFGVCLVIGIIFIFMGIHSFKMLNNTQYLRGIGEGIYQQQALNKAEAPYLAAGAAGAMVLDAANNNNNANYYF